MISKIKQNCYDQFEKRREIVTVVIVFCMFCILYIMFDAKTIPIYTSIIDNSFWLLGSVVLGYIFGRTIGDFAGGRSMKNILGNAVTEAEDTKKVETKEGE